MTNTDTQTVRPSIVSDEHFTHIYKVKEDRTNGTVALCGHKAAPGCSHGTFPEGKVCPRCAERYQQLYGITWAEQIMKRGI